MAGKKVATIGSMHICPMVTGTTPHVGGPISGPGNPGILIDGTPIAVMGDMSVCTGPPDVIVTGCPGVLADGVPIVTETCMTAHGGVVSTGVPGVTVSSSPMKSAVVPLAQIPFPKISLYSKIFAPGLAKVAGQKIEEVKAAITREDDREKRIFNIHWRYDDLRTSESRENKKVSVVADTWGYADGENLTFQIFDEEGEVIKELSATVQDNHIEAEWEIPEATQEKDADSDNPKD